MEIVLLLLTAAVIAAAVLLIRWINQKHRHPFFSADIALCALLGAVILLFNLQETVNERARQSYTVYNGTILSGLYYERAEQGYDIIRYTGMFSNDLIAVPEEQADVSPVSKLYHPVNVYCLPEGRLWDGTVQIAGEEYYFGADVVKIVPDYREMLLLAGILDILILIVVNLTALIVLLVRLIRQRGGKQGKQQIQEENENADE